MKETRGDNPGLPAVPQKRPDSAPALEIEQEALDEKYLTRTMSVSAICLA
jgi:hypothetical protein